VLESCLHGDNFGHKQRFISLRPYLSYMGIENSLTAIRSLGSGR
jgi:hypothetical protein